MPRSRVREVDTLLYRAALRLCPSGFRRAYGEQMVRDFVEAHEAASAGRAGGVWRFRLMMAVDVMRTIVVQWSRTRLPLIGVISGIVALSVAEGVATVARRARFGVPMDAANAEMIGVLILATTSVFVIAVTIVLTLWSTRPIRRGRRWG